MRAAHAVQPPVLAPAPPVQRKPESMPETHEAPQRLLTSLSSVPAVQRKCAPCAGEENDDRMPVQPRLEVGPVDDPYEREADTIAGQVMAMRDPAPASAAGATVQRAPAEMPELVEDDTEIPRMRAMAETSSAAGGAVQRACTVCSNKSEEVQRAPALTEELTPDDEQVPRMRATAGHGGEHIAASSLQLTSGGASLAGPTRDFFESRMGRDLSDVRVHRGTDADALNESISSRAFTFRNHIWLSRAEAEAPSETMAHELAHVLQQTQPGAIRASKRSRTVLGTTVQRAPGAASKAAKKAFAGKAYWTSKKLSSRNKNSGSQIHEDLLGHFQANNPDLFMEAPVPRSLSGARARSGEADLYKGEDKDNKPRTVGINFRGNTPVKVRFNTKQPHYGTAYNHRIDARPKLRGKNTIIDIDKGPMTIWLGELKPQLVKKGEKQLRTYEASFRRTQTKANKHIASQHTDPATQPEQWPGITFNRIDVNAPSLSGLTGDSSGRHELEVRQFAGFRSGKDFALGNLIHTPPTPVHGDLKLRKHGNGIYYYWWEPDPKLVATSTPPDLANLFPLSQKLFTALRTNRKVVLPLRKKKPGGAEHGVAAPRAPGRPGAFRGAQRRLLRGRSVVRHAAADAMVRRRKSGNAKRFKNHFDKAYEGDWIKYRNKVAKGFKEPTGTDLLTDHYLLQIDSKMDSTDSQDLKTKNKNRTAGQRVAKYRAAKLIASPFAPTMAKLRRIFGRVFAKGSELYEKIKAKFERRSKPTKSLSGGGILGALLRASFKVLLLIGRRIVASTMIQLTGQLKGCMRNMFESYFSIDDEIEAVRQRVEGVKDDLETSVQNFIGGDPETLAETLFGPYGQHVDTVRSYIEGITEKAGPILTAYKAVKWGIQALACASPPILGCLWGLARSAIEWAAGKVIETCWFMKKVTPKILKIEKIRNFMRSTSQNLSNGILEAAGSLFPDPVGTFLKTCKTETPRVAMPKSKSICEEGGGSGGMGNNPEPSKDALDFWARWEKLPFKKQMALKKMLGVKTAKGGATVDWGKMNDMLDWAGSTALKEMQRLASEAAKGDSSAIPGPVAKVKHAAEQSKAQASGPGTVADDSEGGEGGSDGGGAAEGESDYAERLGEKGKGGGMVSDLSPFAFVPNSSGTPAKEGDPVVGTVAVKWTKPGSDSPKVKYLVDVRMTFHGVAGTDTIDGEKFDKWNLKAVSSEKFVIKGREGTFFLRTTHMFSLYIIRSD